MELKKQKVQWFIDRIGKRIFRTKAKCPCEVCKKVYEVGLVIADKIHADYLFDCQYDLDLYYYDKKKSNEK